MTRHLRLLLIFVVLALCLLIAACGGGQGQTATGSVHPPGWGKPPPPTALLHARQPSTATVSMYDSVTLSTVPAAPFALAGYTAGHWPTFLPMRRRWPQAHTVSIAISASDHADCLDVEPGDATPAQAPGWVRSDRQAGWAKPCLYSDWWEWVHELAPALERAGIKLGSVFRWVASYVGHPQLLAGFDADQYENHCLGLNLDCSLVLRSFLSIAQPPLHPPRPKPKPKPKPFRARLAQVDRLLGAYDRRRNPRGHDCAKPPFRHAYPSARFNRACAGWAREAKTLRRRIG